MTEPRAQQEVLSLPGSGGVGPRFAWWALGVAALVGLLALGLQREARFRRTPLARSTPRFHFGKSGPAFSLPTAQGGTLASQSLKGKWTVLVFCSSSCPFARKALKSLAPVQQRWKQRLRVVCIVPETGRSAKGLLESCDFPILLDPGRRVHRAYLDRPFQIPSFVFLDPDARMRFLEQGYRTDCKGNNTFVALVSEFFGAHGDVLEPLEPSADGTVVLGDSKRRLSELWRHTTLVLVFIAPGQPASMSIVARSLKFREAPESMKFLFLSPGRPDDRLKRLSVKGKRFLTGCDQSGDLADAYEVRSFPRIFILRDGFFLGRPEQACTRCAAAWEQVAEAALFTCSPRPGGRGGDST